MPWTAKQKRFMSMVKARKSGHDVGGPKVQEASKSIEMSDVNEGLHSPTKAPVRSVASMRKKLAKR